MYVIMNCVLQILVSKMGILLPIETPKTPKILNLLTLLTSLADSGREFQVIAAWIIKEEFI